ncbi:MAG: GPI inositol-deacylase [Nevskiales bacterium]|nr:GPI inositol-deacylase [Nevskiales bacterium]
MLRPHEVSIAPPSKLLLLLEMRAYSEYARLILSWPWLGRLPRGDGHPVLVIPGLGGNDASTYLLRLVLARLGYAAYGWELGANLGMRPHIKNSLRQRLARLHKVHRRKLSLIGWSLGGVFAREIARHMPQYVQQVITLGSPINGHPEANNAMWFYKLVNPRYKVHSDWGDFQRRRMPPPVPCTAIYSKSDGIVAWPCSMEERAPNTENVEVSGSHCGLGYNPQVIRVIAERLARPNTSHFARSAAA